MAAVQSQDQPKKVVPLETVSMVSNLGTKADSNEVATMQKLNNDIGKLEKDITNVNVLT